MMFDGSIIHLNKPMNTSIVHTDLLKYWTAPPSARVTLTSNGDVEYSEGDVIPWNSIVFDTTSSFSTSTGEYTIPIRGTYVAYARFFTNTGQEMRRSCICVVPDGETYDFSTHCSQSGNIGEVAANIQIHFQGGPGDIVRVAAGLGGLKAYMGAGHSEFGVYMVSAY